MRASGRRQHSRLSPHSPSRSRRAATGSVWKSSRPSRRRLKTFPSFPTFPNQRPPSGKVGKVGNVFALNSPTVMVFLAGARAMEKSPRGDRIRPAGKDRAAQAGLVWRRYSPTTAGWRPSPSPRPPPSYPAGVHSFVKNGRRSSAAPHNGGPLLLAIAKRG
jgi:hypothetical protein